MADIKYEIVKHIGIISENANGWKKELNLVSWNNGNPKYDIRDWNEDKSRMTKGITLTEEEILELVNLVNNK
jgi:hypothetical protein